MKPSRIGSQWHQEWGNRHSFGTVMVSHMLLDSAWSLTSTWVVLVKTCDLCRVKCACVGWPAYLVSPVKETGEIRPSTPTLCVGEVGHEKVFLCAGMIDFLGLC